MVLSFDAGVMGLVLPQLGIPEFTDSLGEALLSLRSGWGWGRMGSGSWGREETGN